MARCGGKGYPGCDSCINGELDPFECDTCDNESNWEGDPDIEEDDGDAGIDTTIWLRPEEFA